MNKYKMFSDQATFAKIYLDCREHQPQASDSVRANYDTMRDIFEEYVCAVQEDMFRYAYQCGYETAKAEPLKGGAKSA